MAILETQFADSFSGMTQNYLYDWARRTGNLGAMASYYVEDRIDGSTGRPVYNIRPITDLPVAPSNDTADPAPIDDAISTDTTVLDEVQSMT